MAEIIHYASCRLFSRNSKLVHIHRGKLDREKDTANQEINGSLASRKFGILTQWKFDGFGWNKRMDIIYS